MKRLVPGGFLVALEGIDGAGKSVQAKAVGAALTARGFDVVITREPTDGPWGRLLRESARTGRLAPQDELETFLKDREEHVRTLIRPGLAAGKVVITDRYYFSTVAYQGARGFDPEELLRRNELIAVEPHLLILIDLDAHTGLARIGHRDGQANEFETLAQLSRTREIFLALRKPYLVRVDGAMSPAALTGAILGVVESAITERTAGAARGTSGPVSAP
jgi:dTMP kinase